MISNKKSIYIQRLHMNGIITETDIDKLWILHNEVFGYESKGARTCHNCSRYVLREIKQQILFNELKTF